MSYLVISNRGEVDPQAFTLLGASVKDEGSVGYFGSGNKYAFAALCRLGIKFRVFSGTSEVIFARVATTFRGETFHVLHINGEATSITTRTGPKWEAPDAIREIYSNALDEGNAAHAVLGGEPQGEAGITRVWIELTTEIREMVSTWHLYFLPPDAEVLNETPAGRILDQPVPNYFRRGVWICEDRQQVPLFTYDFKDFNLPESRKVATSTASYYIYQLLYGVENPIILKRLLDNAEGRRGEREWDSLNGIGRCTVTIRNLFAEFEKRFDFIGDTRIKDKVTLTRGERVLWCRSATFNVLHQAGAKDIALALDFNSDYTITDWPIGVQRRVHAEMRFLTSRGIDLSPFDIAFADFVSDQVIAMAEVRKRRVLIGSAAIGADRNMLRKALVEEWTHLAHNVADHTVEQQHVYLNLICSLLEAQGSGALCPASAEEVQY